MTPQEIKKPDYTESDIKHLAQAFDILLEGAIQSHLIDDHGKLATTTTVEVAEAEKVSEGGDD